MLIKHQLSLISYHRRVGKGNLIPILGSESNIAINWFETNKLIVNLGNFQFIIIYFKKKQDHIKETLLKLNLQ